MVHALTVILIGLLFVASARAGLEFSPKPAEYELDGVKFKQITFSDGDKRVTYSPPRGWDYSGSASQLTLHPPHKSKAEAKVSKVILPNPASFDGETIKKLVDEAVASVPHGSTDVQVVSQERNPLMIERKETFLVTLTYTFYGESYCRSLLYLNREKEQIRFQLGCLQTDFKDLQKAFLGSQFSWQNL